MNTRKKLIVKWNPHQPHDTFAVLGNDVRVYQVDWHNPPIPPSRPFAVSRKTLAGIRLVGTNTSYIAQGPVRCAAWSPSEKSILAFGLPTGKVIVTSVANDRVGMKNPSLEFNPRHSRTCNSLSWNPVFPGLLAAGYDKVRSSPSTLIWDASHQHKLSEAAESPQPFQHIPPPPSSASAAPTASFSFSSFSSETPHPSSGLPGSTSSPNLAHLLAPPAPLSASSAPLSASGVALPLSGSANNLAALAKDGAAVIANPALLPSAPSSLLPISSSTASLLSSSSLSLSLSSSSTITSTTTNPTHSSFSSSSSSSAFSPDPLLSGLPVVADFFNVAPSESSFAASEPAFQISTSEAAVAVDWWSSQPRCLATGTGAKWLRLFDIRIKLNAVRSVIAHTRAVNGVTFDPFHPDQIATFSDDGHIKIWDIRSLLKPTGTLPADPKIANIAWSPSRRGVLAAFSGDDAQVRVWHLTSTAHAIQPRKKSLALKRPRHLSFAAQKADPEESLLSQLGDALMPASSAPNATVPGSLSSATASASSNPATSSSLSTTSSSSSTSSNSSSTASLQSSQSLQSSSSSSSSSTASASNNPGGDSPPRHDGSDLLMLDSESGESFDGESKHPDGADPDSASLGGASEEGGASHQPTEVVTYQVNRTCHALDVGEPVSSISWHQSDDAVLAVVTQLGHVKLLTMKEPAVLNWAPCGTLAFSFSKTRALTQVRSDVLLREISTAMHIRAKGGYSLDVRKNSTLDVLPVEHRDLWGWLSRALQHTAAMPRAGTHAVPRSLAGLSALLTNSSSSSLQSSSSSSSSSSTSSSSSLSSSISTASNPDGPKSPRSPRVSQHLHVQPILPMTSAARDQAVALCIGESRVFWQQLLESNQITRAAAHAVFSGHLDVAIQFLQESARAQPAYQLLAIALSGFHASDKELWFRTCASWAQTADIYIQTIFAFLYNDPERLAAILDGPFLNLPDKIVLACRVLADGPLSLWMQRQEQQLFEASDLSGLILCGLEHRGLELLQRYLDVSSDVQTVTLIACQVVPAYFSDRRVARWASFYRQYLNAHELWSIRAEFDLGWQHSANIKSHIFARCQYCNQSVALSNLIASKSSVELPGSFGQGSSALKGTKRTVACPSCNKPLPKCSVCLLNLSCSAPAGSAIAPNPTKAWSDGSTPFKQWFTWCQTCRHGGHAHHLLEWFSKFKICPVSNCTCACSSLQ